MTTTIRIHPGQVRNSGVAAVTVGDDLTAQASALRGLSMPAMPGAMAANYTSAVSGVASTLVSLASGYGSIGEELQVRAVAAEVADAPGEVTNAAAGQTLARSVTTIVAPGGATTTVQVTTSQTGSVASTSTGARVTTPDTLERPAVAASASAAPPDPHADPHAQPTASRDVTGQQQVGGAPAAAVHQALGAVSSESGPATASGSQRYTADPSDMPAGEHRAESAVAGGAGGADGGGAAGGGHAVPAHVDMPPVHETDRQDWACWMAASAAHEGLPPLLPVMMALSQGGLRNMPGGESDAGFFGIDPRAAFAPSGAGVAPGAHQPGEWWADHPGAQLDHVVARLTGSGGGIRDAKLDDPEALGHWASEAVPGIDAGQFGETHAAASELLSHCRMEHAAVAPAAGGPLAVAKGQLGVHEVGDNTGPQVNRFLASADVGPGNPWCAGFVTWSVEQSGHEMPGGGWAAVSTWVNAAENGQHGLHVVDAASARPGDIVAYDWGHGTDFAADGHIGFLESSVGGDGSFTTVEGNSGDAVQRMDRNVSVANVVFIRLAG